MYTFNIDKIIKEALKEDITNQDVTTNCLVPDDHISEAKIIFREDATVSGLDFAKRVFELIDPTLKFKPLHKDGDAVKANEPIASLKGKTSTILKGERTALNFLAYLSGISTKTAHFVKAIKGTNAQILDTRKTTPGLRHFEKYAVRTGGGINHRFNLSEMVLIKDNHREICHPSMTTDQVVLAIKKRTKKIIAVEVDTLIQFKNALKAAPDIILLDNMTLEQMKKAVKTNDDFYRKKLIHKKPLLEASGGITLKNVKAIAKIGIDRISLGCLTHTHRAIDVSMEIIN
ncbi:carboxylating nicotinate-nucleotide diphosphorylase [Candidatus Omnitrophota bacterium]